MSDLTDKIGGRRVIASVSGGKDSAAMSLWLTEQGIEHDRVFADTGWEHPDTIAYLRGPLTKALGPIHEIRGPRQMEELILHKGMFPSRVRRFCTQELKVFPLAKFVKSRSSELDTEVVNAVGIRAEESEARSKVPEWEWQETFECEVWRPLLRWTLDDVVAIHKRHGLSPNPLYLRGASRVGCWPCIYARKEEIRFVAQSDPERISLIRDLEARVDAQQIERRDKRERERERRKRRRSRTNGQLFSDSGRSAKAREPVRLSMKSSSGRRPNAAGGSTGSSTLGRPMRAA